MKRTAVKCALAVVAFLIISGFIFNTTAFAAQKKNSHVAVKKTIHKTVKKRVSTYSKHTTKVKVSYKKILPVRLSGSRTTVAGAAEQFLGVPYVYGAAGPTSFDCSGLSMYVYKAFGVSLPHSAKAQSKLGQYISKSDLKPGDLVFFTTDGSGKVSHVGIYIGSGNFIQAPRTGEDVSIASLSESYYSRRYVTARRFI